MRIHRVILAAALAALSLHAGSAAGAAETTEIAVRGTDYGPILVDGRGLALYAFTRYGRSGSRCTGVCAKRWPPFIVRGAVTAGRGAKASLLGTLRRKDGSRQVTYAGRPLYFYVGDKRPGQVLCQNVSEFGGLWLVVRANGRLVRGG